MLGGVTCEIGWTLSTKAGRCYKGVTLNRDWAGARAYCQGQGTTGDLASIPDLETNELVLSLISGSGMYWLGGTDAASEVELQTKVHDFPITRQGLLLFDRAY